MSQALLQPDQSVPSINQSIVVGDAPTLTLNTSNQQSMPPTHYYQHVATPTMKKIHSQPCAQNPQFQARNHPNVNVEKIDSSECDTNPRNKSSFNFEQALLSHDLQKIHE